MKTALITRQPGPVFGDPFFRGLDRFFDQPFGGRIHNRSGEGLTESRWTPAIDVRETDEAFVFTAEIPGLAKDDVDITIEDKVLTLSGERKFESDEERNGYHRIERAYGTFNRSFTLPHVVEQDKVTAAFKDGLLTVSIPKAEEAKPRKIEIS